MQIITTLILALTCLFISTNTFAAQIMDPGSSDPQRQNSSRSQQRPEDIQQNTQEGREAQEGNLSESRQEGREGTRELRNNLAQRHADRVSRRFNFYYQRLSTLIDKVDNRLNQMDSEGKDVTAAQAKLAEAVVTLNAAKSLGDQAVAAFVALEAAGGEASDDMIIAASELAKEARESYKATVLLIREAVQLAKSAE